MEIIYQINDIDKLKKYHITNKEIRWMDLNRDLYKIYLFLKDRKPDIIFNEKEMYRMYMKWFEEGCIYCAIFDNERIIAMAAVEKYSSIKWETADVRVIQSERKKGYAKQICYFVTKFILESGIIATCRTEETNVAMQKVISDLGFIKCSQVQVN